MVRHNNFGMVRFSGNFGQQHVDAADGRGSRVINDNRGTAAVVVFFLAVADRVAGDKTLCEFSDLF